MANKITDECKSKSVLCSQIEESERSGEVGEKEDDDVPLKQGD